jgi:hypothetical protein
VILQLLNTFSANPLVKDGVGWNYVLVVIAQCAWTIVFGFEWIILSVVAMLAILFFLVRIVRAQHRIEPNADYKDFILLKFPFDIHCGWIFAAKLVNANVLFVDLGLNSTIQFYSALASLLILILIALFFGFSHMNMVIPLVLAWASVSRLWGNSSCRILSADLLMFSALVSFGQFGIYNELKNPKQLVSETFTENQITYTQYGSLAAASIASLVVVYVGVKLLMAWWKNRSDSQNTGSVNKKTADQTASETDYVRADYEMSGTKA